MGEARLGRVSPPALVPGDPPRLKMWNKRAARARLLADRYQPSREILLFYADLAEWQGLVAGKAHTIERLTGFLDSLVDLIHRTGPDALVDAAKGIDPSRMALLLDDCWAGRDDSVSPLAFFSRALLQPYAAGLPADQMCPWCRRSPQAGCLRPQGEGLALDLVCGLCLRGRPYPRGLCPGCGESAEAKVAHYSAPDFAHMRLQICESCLLYLPLIDLSVDPQAIPEVDELAGLPLYLWAAEQGYRKLQTNLAGV